MEQLVDTHAHLSLGIFRKDWRRVVERARSAGVGKILVVGTDLQSSRRACEMAALLPSLYAGVGIHPSYAHALSRADLHHLSLLLFSLAKKAKVVAIGEIGLDYRQHEDSIALQKELLAMQVSLAKKLTLPVIVHVRGAQTDILPALRDSSGGDLPQGVFHCFSGSKTYLTDVLSSGFFVSFTCNITSSHGVARRSLNVPLERLLLESDAPFMAPSSFQGKRNEPLSVTILAKRHADLRRIQLSEVAHQTTANARFLFRL